MAYLDEQDDLDRWLRDQQAPNLGPTPQPVAAPEQAGTWARAAQMLGGQAHNSAPDPAPKPSALDSWGTILGMLASRDPGSVLAQDAAGRRAAVDAWQRRQAGRDDASFGRQAQAAHLLMQEDAAKRAVSEDDVRRGNLDARRAELSLAERQLDARLGKTGPWAEAQRLVTGAPQPSPDDVRGARAAADAVGHFEAPPASAALDQPGPDEVRDARAGGFEAPAGPAADPKLKRGGAAPAAASGDLLLIPGTEVVDDAVARRTMGDTVTRRGLEKDLAVLFDAERSLRRMKEIRESAGIEPGKSADKSEYNRLRSAVVAAESKLSSQGVVSPTEFKLHVKDIPGLEYSDDIIGNTGKLAGELVGKDYDPTRDALSGTHKAIVDAINAGLSVRGLRMAGEPKPPPAAAAAGEQPPPAGDTLPTTTGKAPPLPADATQGADVKTPRNVIKPNGSRVVYPLSDDEYRRLMAKPGWGSF
jgi:hypothetical protein